MARGKSRADRRGPSRRSGQSEDSGGLRWLVTYGDMVTLLLAFFVILYTMSVIDQEKFEKFLLGLAVPFGNPAFEQHPLAEPDGVTGELQQDPDLRLEQLAIVDFFDRRADAAETPETPDEDDPFEPPGEQWLPEADAFDAGLPDDLAAVRDAIAAALEAAGLSQHAELELTVRGLVISIATDRVLFATGSAEISPEGERIIGAVAPSLAALDHEIRVEGHTDTQPLNRHGYTNWHLSADRALAVLSLLYRSHAIAEPRLSATGFGEFRPRAPNDPATRAHNRRVEIVVLREHKEF